MNFLNAYVRSQGLKCCGKNNFLFNHSLGMQLLSLIYGNFNQGYNTKTHAAITLVSFASDNIFSGYAAYSFSINSLYALRRNYSFSLFTPSLSDVFDPVDYRWSRVKILNWMFEGNGNISDKYSSYFVWIDADLIFLDFDFDILQDVVYYDNRTKHADIIISAENHAETGVANTGCFIIKNSSWSRQFLSQWWQEDNATRASAHDQIFFDRLYKRYLKENPIETHLHIVVLPTRVLNSMPPALLQLAESDHVLHLMGEKDELREVVFSYALQQWCCSSSGFKDSSEGTSSSDPIQQGHLSHPLNITPSTLIDISYGWYSATLTKLIQFIDNTVSFIASSTTVTTASQGCDILFSFVDLFDKIGQARELLLQIRNLEYRLYNDLSMSAESLKKIFNFLISSSRQFQSLFPHSQGIPLCYHAVAKLSYNYFRLHLNNLCSLIGNDYLSILSEAASGWSIRSPSLSPSLEEQTNMYAVVEGCLYSLEAVTDLASKPVVLSALAIFMQNMGSFYLSLSESPQHHHRHHHKGIQILQRSVDILWNELPEGLVNPFQKVSPALLLGSALCSEDTSLFHQCIEVEQHEGECTSQVYGDDNSRLRYGEELLIRTIELLEQLLFAEQQQKDDHINYANALFAAAKCRRLLHPVTTKADADPHMQKLIRLRDRFCLFGANSAVDEGSKLCHYLNETLHQLRYSSTQTVISTYKNMSSNDSRKKKKIRLSRRLLEDKRRENFVQNN